MQHSIKSPEMTEDSVNIREGLVYTYAHGRLPDFKVLKIWEKNNRKMVQYSYTESNRVKIMSYLMSHFEKSFNLGVLKVIS